MDLSALLPLALLGIGGLIAYLNVNPTAGISDKLSFVRKFGPIAQEAVKAQGWPIIVIPLLVAWAAMESAWGTSGLATGANNLFGVKAGPTWIGQGSAYITLPTQEYQGTAKQVNTTASFRKYGSWGESLTDLLHMLSVTTIYQAAYKALARGDYQGFYQAIDASGYSTANRYSDRIKNFVSDVGNVA